ncbi:unnamed protein product [Haemonchus placei]|uniref:Uncharacterized protein n=1 Tax=Haemonchus placei TaxID=6290 RepID=A0A0N4W727_HAEPC|nr:unnamed protein product [Haemonchus placei]
MEYAGRATSCAAASPNLREDSSLYLDFTTRILRFNGQKTTMSQMLITIPIKKNSSR